MEKGKHLQINGAGITGWQHVEDCNRSISITIHKTQIQMDHVPQHKFSYIETDGRENGK